MALKIGNGLDLQSQKIVNLADPSASTDAANKNYVDNKVAGLAWKQPVKVATTTNGTLATAYANGQSVDGVTLATGDRILLKDQTAGAENGIYTVNASGAPTRATDADSTAELESATVYVISGTANADKAFTQTANAPTVGTTALVFSQVGGGTAYSAGNGLSLSSTTFSVQANGTSIDVSASGVKIADAAAGSGLGVSAGVLSVNTGTGLEVSGDNVRLAAATGTGLTGGGASALAVDTTVVATKYTATLGAVTGGSAVTVTHNLGVKNVICQIFIESTGEMVLADVVLSSTTALTITFATSQSSGFYRVVVVG